MNNDSLGTPAVTALPPNLQPPPKVLTWFKGYLAILCLMYLLVIALGVFVFYSASAKPDRFGDEHPAWTGWAMVILGVLFLIASALPFFLRSKPWVWVYDLVVICSGMTSVCLVPASIALLIFWIKPETRKHFGRSDI